MLTTVTSILIATAVVSCRDTAGWMLSIEMSGLVIVTSYEELIWCHASTAHALQLFLVVCYGMLEYSVHDGLTITAAVTATVYRHHTKTLTITNADTC